MITTTTEVVCSAVVWAALCRLVSEGYISLRSSTRSWIGQGLVIGLHDKASNRRLVTCPNHRSHSCLITTNIERLTLRRLSDVVGPDLSACPHLHMTQSPPTNHAILGCSLANAQVFYSVSLPITVYNKLFHISTYDSVPDSSLIIF